MWFLLKASFCVASLTLNAKKSKGSRGIQTSDYPDPYKTVTARQEFVDLYDLSEVPRIERATPHNAEQPVDCTKLNSDTCSWGCGGCIRSSEIRSCPNQKHWGLSFADGPSSVTKQLLDDLKAAKVNATFFVTGGQSIQFQTQLRDTHAAGHQICILNWSHRALTSMSTEVVVTDLEYTLRLVHEVTGVRPDCVRPPFGDIDDRIRAIFMAMKLKTFMWNHDTNDWKLNLDPNAVDVVSRAKVIARGWRNRLRGIISLEQDLTEITVSKAAGLIAAVKSQGMIPMSIRDCMESLPVSQNGSCGDAAQKICPRNTCCSQYNFCGRTPKHCGRKCQPLYGKCD